MNQSEPHFILFITTCCIPTTTDNRSEKGINAAMQIEKKNCLIQFVISLFITEFSLMKIGFKLLFDIDILPIIRTFFPKRISPFNVSESHSRSDGAPKGNRSLNKSILE